MYHFGQIPSTNLIVRQCSVNQYPYTIQQGDTLFIIAYRLDTTVSSILRANPGLDPSNLQVGQSICIPACPPNHNAYIIQAGDTLWRIAQTFGVTITSILAANPSVEPDNLRVGQRICIPNCEVCLN
ncbi:LysM domain-containing protein [Bacillaceae bacterium CLA-AA-H227]|uniref:LysM domain-containing protein n=1 Tax=Robertmurraya yapensis (ex Hitch et al 2024) TaxID=3133160 RepID=A0ACC6SB31_9BACI